MVAFAGISIIYNYISSMVSYGSLLLSSTTVLFTFLIFIFLTLCVVVYMGVNSVREFMQKRIKLRPLYMVMAILTLVSLLAGAVRVSRVYATRPLHIIDLIYYLTLVLMVYFTVVDFIQQFIKKKEEKFYTDADFEAAEEEK